MAGSVDSSCVQDVSSLQSHSSACSEEMWGHLLGARVYLQCYLSLCTAAARHQGNDLPRKRKICFFFLLLLCSSLNPQLTIRSF